MNIYPYVTLTLIYLTAYLLIKNGRTGPSGSEEQEFDGSETDPEMRSPTPSLFILCKLSIRDEKSFMYATYYRV